MEKKFTKGKWYVEKTNTLTVWGGDNIRIADFSVTNLISPREKEGNARLCAEAPLLLAMLEDIVKIWKEMDKINDTPNPFIEVAEKAIQKAYGEQ